MVLALVLLSVLSVKYVVLGSIGENFVDQFETFDDNIWQKETNVMSCLEASESPQCVYANDKNLVTKSLWDITPPQHYLQMSMRNNCVGKQCCKGLSTCTKYTAGQISSQKSFFYGSFRFVALAEGSLDVTVGWYDAWSCFSLEGYAYVNPEPMIEEIRMEISLCVSTMEPWVVSMVWKYGHMVHIQSAHLPFNVGRGLHVYRFDWQPDYIKWYVDSKLVGWIKESERQIPDAPMRLRIGIFPADELRPKSKKVKVSYRLQLFQVKFTKEFLDLSPHFTKVLQGSLRVNTELIVDGNRTSTSLKLILLMCALLIFSINMIIWVYRHHECDAAANSVDGYYTLLMEPHCVSEEQIFD